MSMKSKTVKEIAMALHTEGSHNHKRFTSAELRDRIQKQTQDFVALKLFGLLIPDHEEIEDARTEARLDAQAERAADELESKE